MPLVTSTEMFKKAYEGHYAVGAFNVNNMEIIQGIVAAAQQEKSPLILQVSAGARKYANQTLLRYMAQGAVEYAKELGWAKPQIVLHLDHGDSFELCKSCVDMGFSSVMIDGSHLPYDENVALTKQVVDYAHQHDVTVEGELGVLAGVEDEVVAEESHYTKPEEVVDFVTKTGVDSLAISIGTSHGAYKFTRKPTGETLSIQRVKEIHERLPNTHLVMHGSSSVPQEYLATIRQFGGDMRETYGVPVEEIQEAIKHGVRKVNIDTDIRLAMTAATRQYLFENPSKFDPRDFLKVARKAATELCKQRYLQFGCEGMASRIKPLPLDVVAARYADGTLRQNVL